MHKSLSVKLQWFIQEKPFYMVIINNKNKDYDSVPVYKYNLTRYINLEDPNEPYDDHTNVWRNKYGAFTDFERYNVNSLLKEDYVFVEVFSTVYGEGYSAEQLLFDFFESLSDVVEIDTEFNPNLKSLDDRVLYIIAVKDSNILNDKEFSIVKNVVFFGSCNQVKMLRNSELKEFFKKLIHLNIKLKLIR